MPTSSESALALTGYLRALSDAQLADLLAAREVRENGIKDFFDLADALLDADSVQSALTRLDRSVLTTLRALSDLGPVSRVDAAAHLTAIGADPAALADHLALGTSLALVVETELMVEVPMPVAQQLQRWPELGLPSLDELISTPAPTALAPVSSVDARFVDGVSAEHGFATTTAVGELVASLGHEPARELARGGIALPDSKRLAASMSLELDAVPELVEIASRAGLVAREDGHWMSTPAGSTWMVSGSGERWATLAGAWLQRLPIDIRGILSQSAHGAWGERLLDYAVWLYPAGGDWMRERVASYTRHAELLGITANAVPSTPGIALFESGPDAAGTAMAALFPPEVRQVYLQHDLTVVSPGPLAPELDARLRGMADVEGRALASSYRISTASLYRALAAGETADSIKRFLSEIALTGIPQPLAYLVTEATARYGLVRVGAVDGGRAYVRSTDDTLLRTIAVDQALAPLGLTRAGDRLISRFDRDLVFWAISEARYPVAAEDGSGQIVLVARRQATRSASVPEAAPPIGLIEKLRLGSSTDPDVTGQAWLARQLDVAIRGKLGLTVTILMPDGRTQDYQLEPASIGGGRMRARDRKADIERTLPLSSIVSVGPPAP